MSDFVERLFQERTELCPSIWDSALERKWYGQIQRLTSLEQFIGNESFKELAPSNRKDLLDQRKCMIALLEVLNRRVWNLCIPHDGSRV